MWASSDDAVKTHQASAIFVGVKNKTHQTLLCGQQVKMSRGHIFFMGNAAEIPAGQRSGDGFDGIFVTADSEDQAVGSFHCVVAPAADEGSGADIALFFEYGFIKATLGNLLTSIKLRGFAQADDPYEVTVDKSHAFRAHIDPPHLLYTIRRLPS